MKKRLNYYNLETIIIVFLVILVIVTDTLFFMKKISFILAFPINILSIIIGKILNLFREINTEVKRLRKPKQIFNIYVDGDLIDTYEI